MQVLFLAVLIGALHTALEHGIMAFNGVGDLMAIAANVFALAVSNSVVVEPVDFRDVLVGVGFVGHQLSVFAHVGAKDGLNIGNANAVNVEAGRAAALNESHDNILIGPSGAALPGCAFNAAKVSSASTVPPLLPMGEVSVERIASRMR